MIEKITPSRIEPQTLEYRDERTPYSSRFDDIYFSSTDGIEESKTLYLRGSGAEAAILRGDSSICIGEIGFGVGLNFILTLDAFIQNAKADQVLEYISVERYPIHLDCLKRLYARYPELVETAEILLKQYPILTPGFHPIHFATPSGARVRLLLLLGDAHEMLSRLNAKIDFWYWDGFAPSRNPDTFSEDLFLQVKRLSSPHAQGTSFTCAGWVRRALEKHHFLVEKRAGFGKKRESIFAQVNPHSDEAPETKPRTSEPLAPWFSHQSLPILLKTQTVAVVGAGLAGSAIARALAHRGYFVTVFAPGGIANRASGNSVGLFNVQLSMKPNPINRFAQLSLAMLLRELKSYPKLPVQWGIQRDDGSTPELLRASDYPDDFYDWRNEALFFPYCGILNPKMLCEARLDHPNIEVHKAEWSHQPFDHIIFATGADIRIAPSFQNTNLESIPFKAVRGQILSIRPTEASKKLIHTRVKKGYLTPLVPTITGHENHVLGATYQAKAIHPEQNQLDRQQLIQEAKEKWYADWSMDQVESEREGYRLSTPDKLPTVGPVVDPHWLKEQYEKKLKGASYLPTPDLEVPRPEWIIMGLGSRGITQSTLCAEILASIMCKESLPIESDLWEHVHSARFAVRSIKKSDNP